MGDSANEEVDCVGEDEEEEGESAGDADEEDGGAEETPGTLVAVFRWEHAW